MSAAAAGVKPGTIWYIMGKSASGKDSLYRELLQRIPSLRTYVMYTTRPMREHEIDGVTYHFTDQAAIDAFAAEGRLIESRTYQTIYGPWTYATVDDGQIDLAAGSYLMPGTLESYEKIRKYYAGSVIPVYIEVEDGQRLMRAIRREMEERCRSMRSCAAASWRTRRTSPRRGCRQPALKNAMKTMILKAASAGS